MTSLARRCALQAHPVASCALDAAQGTGRANYDTGPAEDGLTPPQRFEGLPGLELNVLAQAGQGGSTSGAR